MRGSRHLRHEPEQSRSRVLLKFIHLHHCGLFDAIYAGKLNEPSVHVAAFASLTRSSAWTASSGEAQPTKSSLSPPAEAKHKHFINAVQWTEFYFY